jgi:hypothetical protein
MGRTGLREEPGLPTEAKKAGELKWSVAHDEVPVCSFRIAMKRLRSKNGEAPGYLGVLVASGGEFQDPRHQPFVVPQLGRAVQHRGRTRTTEWAPLTQTTFAATASCSGLESTVGRAG